MATKTNQVFVQVGNEVIELKGVELEALLQTQKEMQNEVKAEKAATELRATQRQTIADRLGLTADELKLLLG